jgi:signal transduction histidine kinase
MRYHAVRKTIGIHREEAAMKGEGKSAPDVPGTVPEAASERARHAASPRSAARRSALVLAVALVEGPLLLALGAPDQQGSAPVNALLAVLGIAAFLVLMGLALWFARDAARSKRVALLADERSEEAGRRQREAETRARIAGELHDSVGHDLTAIIALTEGVDAAQRADADLARVLERVNGLARAGLADTRRAVASLEEAETHAVGRGPSPLAGHSWDEIPPLLVEVRMTGRAAPFSEVGQRPDDLRQAGLAYLVVREGVTNALRHAGHANCIAVSLEHVADGSCRIAVRDDGEDASAGAPGGDTPNNANGDGTGLRRLAAQVGAAGGTIGWGPDEGGWSLEASIPALNRGEAR